MSDEITRSEFEELKERVEQLEGQIDGSESCSETMYDRYDSYVLESVESATDAHPRQLIKLYEESGIVDKKKAKRRVKRLKKLEGGKQ